MADELELYKKHRPGSLRAMVGQDKAVGQLSGMIKAGNIPHTILFSGPSGCGKTTLARILKAKLNCSDSDFAEMNCADFRGIDSVRGIRQRMGLAPIGGECRIWLVDEAHKLSNDAQNAFLKILEDTPRHVYFFLCTTDPQKLLKTIITRCTEIRLGEVGEKDLAALVSKVARREGRELAGELVEKIAEVAEGSARKALVLLHQVIDMADAAEQLEAVQKSDSKRQAIEIARALMNARTKWAAVAAILREVDEEPETIRRMILGYANAVLLKGGNARAFNIIQSFRDHFFDSGKAGLTAACFEVLQE